ncbi:MAG: hypothetical protein HZA51_13430 [Planctomycetes bacterium]|nr:hypothetical protein [Planctomycetota bacterium]
MFSMFLAIMVFAMVLRYVMPKVMRMARENPAAFKSGMYALKRMFGK